MAASFEAIYSQYQVESTFPGVGSGSTEAEAGANPVPAVGWVHQTRNPNVKIGVGLFGAAGFTTNVPADPTNPVLSPSPSQGGLGVGRVQSDAIFLQLAPSVSVALTDRLSVAAGLVINNGKISLDQNPFVAPNADGTYPAGTGTRYAWGLGAQFGFYYIHNCCWSFGANLKTPMWFESLRYFSEDANGLPRTDAVDVSLPLILSLGTAYTGIRNTMVAADVRYLNYSQTDGFGGDSGYAPNGAVRSLGWNDVVSLHLGVQRYLTPRFTARAGYSYSSNLIDDELTFFNVGADLSYQHFLAVGGTYNLTDCVAASLAYNYLPQWDSEGPLDYPGIGPIPGSSVRNQLDAHIATIGINVSY
jgi:long-chain fatty acid transport protein